MSNLQEHMHQQLKRHLVQRAIFCPVTGDLLDVRTAKFFVDEDGDPAYVLSPVAYEAATNIIEIVNAMARKGLYPTEES